MDNTQSTCVIGHMAENWPGLCSDRPAMIVNPDATPLDVLAWCRGEVVYLECTAHVLAAGDEVAGDISAMLLHRLRPLIAAMDLVVGELQNAARRLPEGSAV